ncbi:concanavalin A-like lectin/glucanase domain-containing protein [Syncephalis plumigaleata]|nr:concanavalin A-like lectin/glucanase domain-containing protein [Syncephalis plumigaleata]
MILTTLFAVALAISHLDSTYAICKNDGKVCDASAPCCFAGTCGSDVKSCSEGCQPSDSFSSASVFTNSSRIQPRSEYNGNPNSVDWIIEDGPRYASIEDNQLMMQMKVGDTLNKFGKKQGVGATISWSRYMEYGRMTAVIKTAVTSPGVVSSFITMSPEGDEIDFEWVGKNRKQGSEHALEFDTTVDFHEYSIDWQPDYISWYVDGKLIRTAQRSTTRQSNGTYNYPSKLSHVQMGIWDGGQGAKGTAEWAGTPTDWTDPNAVYKMYIKDVKIECRYPNATTWPPTNGNDSSSTNDNTTTTTSSSSSSASASITSSNTASSPTPQASTSDLLASATSSTSSATVDASSSTVPAPNVPSNSFTATDYAPGVYSVTSTESKATPTATDKYEYTAESTSYPSTSTSNTTYDATGANAAYGGVDATDANTAYDGVDATDVNTAYGDVDTSSNSLPPTYHKHPYNCSCRKCVAARNQLAGYY